jgi:mono/diheme cytochrome c family protein
MDGAIPNGRLELPSGRDAMKLRGKTIFTAFCMSAIFCAGAACAQDAAVNSGRNVFMSKCFQCHTDSIFRDQHLDRRGWEAVIYRMIGRGALYTTEEIKLMADYLDANFGPDAKSGATAK